MRAIMNPLAHIRRNLPHIIVAALTIALLGAIAFAHLRDSELVSHLADAFVNSLHGPGFAFVAIFVLTVLRVYHRSLANYLYAAAIAMGIGVLSEAAQIPGPRDASALDLILDAIGIVGGLGSFAIFDRDLRSRLNDWFLPGLGTVTALALLATCVPTTFLGYAAISQHRAMPTLLSFDNFWEKAIYHQTWRRRPQLVQASSDWPKNSNVIAFAEEAGRSGLLIRLEPFPDWSEYSALSFVAASGNENDQEISLMVRDLAAEGERRGEIYLSQIRVDLVPKRYVVPLEELRENTNGQSLDLTRISSITLSAANPGSGTKLFFDDFRLD